MRSGLNDFKPVPDGLVSPQNKPRIGRPTKASSIKILSGWPGINHGTHRWPRLARLHQLDAIFTIFGASDRDKRLILQS